MDDSYSSYEEWKPDYITTAAAAVASPEIILVR